MDNIKHSDPLETIIDFAWSAGADKFWVNNAKDELKRLREEIDNLRNIFDKPAAWARINSRGDLYDPRLQYNPFIDESTVVPLYADRSTFKSFMQDNK